MQRVAGAAAGFAGYLVKESWEHIAPELPPGARGSGKWGADAAWKWFTKDTGITRKRYAKLIAVERVREVAAKWWGDELDICVAISTQAVAIAVGRPEPGRPSPIEVTGPTLCDAAWEVIQALGGGE